ncbi:hypothetical protein BJX99DRAFT_228851 [Aspergillus californicus]
MSPGHLWRNRRYRPTTRALGQVQYQNNLVRPRALPRELPQAARQDPRHRSRASPHRSTHEFLSTLSKEQQRDVLARSIEIVTAFTGKKPRGWTAPCWLTLKEDCAPSRGVRDGI